MVSFIFDHEYAGDLASLGIEYQSHPDNDYEVIVETNSDDPMINYLKDNADCYYDINS